MKHRIRNILIFAFIMLCHFTSMAADSKNPKLFIKRIHKIATGDTPSRTLADSLTRLLTAKQKTGADILCNFSNLPQSNSKPDSLYIGDLLTIIPNHIEQKERDKLLSYLENGISRKYVCNYIINSESFHNLCAKHGIERGNAGVLENRDRNAELTMLAQHVFSFANNRKASAEELNLLLNDNATAASVADNIVCNSPIMSTLSNSLYVECLASALAINLRDREREHYIGLLSQNYTHRAILRLIVNSEDFDSYCKEHGIERGQLHIGGWKNNEDGLTFIDHISGAKVTGYFSADGEMCYFDENGILRTNWNKVEWVTDTISELYSYDKLCADIERLAKQYPSLLTIDTLGATADGRIVFDLVIGKDNSSRQVIVQATSHAREYMCSQLAMCQTEHFLQNFWSGSFDGASYSELTEDCQLHIIPMLNPDGVCISQFGLDSIRDPHIRDNIMKIYYAENPKARNRPELNSFLRMWKSNALGVDLNRNFDVNRHFKTFLKSPRSANYRGPNGHSELETQALVGLVESLGNIVTMISYHSAGEEIFWAYGQKGDFLQQCQNLAEGLKDITNYEYHSEEDFGTGCSNWATSKGIKAATIEIGLGTSPLPISQFQKIWNDNKDVLPFLMKSR